MLLDSNQLNMQPVNDPVSTVVMQTSLANVDSVMVGGQFKKRGGRLLMETQQGIAELATSGHRIHAELLAREAQSTQEVTP